jgi:hypothetical protein
MAGAGTTKAALQKVALALVRTYLVRADLWQALT